MGTNDLKVLIVDDSRAMLAAAEATLRSLDIQDVVSCSSGEESLKFVKGATPPFDLLFIDLNMPGMDGIELIHKLSDMRYEGAVVILSALDSKIIQLAEQVTTSMRIRLTGCINKPIDQEKVERLLHKMKTMRSIYQSNYEQLNELELSRAIHQHQLIPYYQPKVSTRTGEVRGLEVLARINSPLLMNVITPNQFIPTAERHNLIDELTFELIDHALKDLPQLRDEFGESCRISINISPNTLHNNRFPEQLLELVERNGVTPHQLMLEITENVAIDETTQLETLGRLRIKGFELALDDFGTGFTNIQQLKNLPFSEIKLDRSLIINIATDSMSQVITHSLMDIFTESTVEVVAEGIDNEDDLNYLNTLSDKLLLQGYIISKPKGLEEICRWHHSWKKLFEAST